jgi:hypothetical protein
MKLNSHKPDIAVQPLWQNLDWLNKSCLKPSPSEFQADTWVHLLELPSTFSDDEALLLCQISEDEWVGWIPNHGEAVLHTRQFCQVC